MGLFRPVPLESLSDGLYSTYVTCFLISDRNISSNPLGSDLNSEPNVWTWRQSRVKSRAALEDRECIYFAFAFACVVGKTRRPPKLSTMADDAITRGGIGSLLSLVYICVIRAFTLKKTHPFTQCRKFDAEPFTIWILSGLRIRIDWIRALVYSKPH